MAERTVAPDARIGEPCPRCGRTVRPDPKTPGCYLGRCISGLTDDDMRPRPPRRQLADQSTPCCVDEINRIVRPLQLSFADIDSVVAGMTWGKP